MVTLYFLVQCKRNVQYGTVPRSGGSVNFSEYRYKSTGYITYTLFE
jgi:hypothetical protein